MFIIGVIFGIVFTLGFGKWYFERHCINITEDDINDERTGKYP